MPTENPDDARKAWMRTLALADWKELQSLGSQYEAVAHDVIRPAETGLIMVRGRIGGTGGAFNLGEATVTRCAVRMGKTEGHAYVLGRNADHARLAAVCDAMLQDKDTRAEIEAQVIAPLEAKFLNRRLEAARQSAATRVAAGYRRSPRRRLRAANHAASKDVVSSGCRFSRH